MLTPLRAVRYAISSLIALSMVIRETIQVCIGIIVQCILNRSREGQNTPF